MIRSLFLVALLLTGLSAVRQLSPIPLPRNEVIDLDPRLYDRHTLLELAERGYLFTFLAKTSQTTDETLRQLRAQILQEMGWTTNPAAGTLETYRLALVFVPSRLGPYRHSIAKTAAGYLLYRGGPFEMESFDFDANATEAMMAQILQSTRDYDLTIAPLRADEAEEICRHPLEGLLFIPNVHADEAACDNAQVRFGAIDYRRQIAELLAFHEEGPLYVVYDHTPLSKKLTQITLEYRPDAVTLDLAASRYFKPLFEQNPDINGSTLLIHTPVVKTSLFLSQMTLVDMQPSRVLSTQINYTPRLLTLTQYHDRETMILADAIGKADEKLTQSLETMGADIRYNWLNYATLTGLDEAFSAQTGLPRLSDTPLQGDRFVYPLRYYEAGLYRFIEHQPPAITPMTEATPPDRAESWPDAPLSDRPTGPGL